MITMILLSLTACGDPPNPAKVDPAANKLKLEVVVDQLTSPWGMTFLPDGAMLITEKSGKLLWFKDGMKRVIPGLPDDFYAYGQGGLMDIVLHPKYSENGWIYITYSHSTDGSTGSTALIRAKLSSDYKLTNVEILYKATTLSGRGVHFGSRIVFDRYGYVYFSIGDRGQRDINPQDPKRDNGKVYRLHDDGRIPADNPFVGKAGHKEAIWSYGHRNPQGMALHPVTGEIWTHEHGPRGGDEINIIQKGKNYGWPKYSHGINYSGTSFAEDTTGTDAVDPIHYWTPSIAPCGMAFINSDKYPGWRNFLLVGSLKFQYLALVHLKGNTVIKETKLMDGVGRLRNVVMGPDGYIYAATEGNGKIYRLVMEE